MKESFTIRIEPNMRIELQKLADKDNRSLSDYIRLQLKKLIEENKKKK